MKIVTIGSRIFVTSFQLAGVQGVVVDTPQDAFSEVKKLANDPEVGLVLISEDMSTPISTELTKLRATKSKPLVKFVKVPVVPDAPPEVAPEIPPDPAFPLIPPTL